MQKMTGTFFETVEGASPEALRLIDVLSTAQDLTPQVSIPALVGVGLTHSEVATMALADGAEEVERWATGGLMTRRQSRYLLGASYNVLLLLREYGDTDLVTEHMRVGRDELSGESIIEASRTNRVQARRSVSDFAIARFNAEA